MLESWGLEVAPLAEPVAHRYMAASDAMRAKALEAAFEDDSIRAVLAARGGFGCARLIEHLDVERIRAHPKIFVGFSDVSLLLAHLAQRAGLVCYHGPMVAADLAQLDPAAAERFRRFLFGRSDWFDGGARHAWREGKASGVLTGGCLSVLVAALGTSYDIDTEGRVLFLEDVAEKPYRIDRMMTQLRHAGKLDGIAALVMGPMTDCDGGLGPEVLREIVLEALSGTSCPVLFGFEAGHGSSNVVLPFGCRVKVDADRQQLDLLEPVLAS